jgi:hypothetical protein
MTGTPPPQRRALLLGCGTFADRSLPALRSPRRDVEQFGGVLRDPSNCRYTVTAEVDCTSRHAQRAIEGFFADARISDGINLLYLSCHGVQDARGQLYFAFTDTERAFLRSTAVPADWVREQIYASRSKATLVLIDCCFSGAFITGMRARSSTHANVESLVPDLPAGSGMAVLTASGETEVSFEDAASEMIRPSYFTDALITGIASGSADLNRDGRVTVDELYDYIYDQVRSGPSPQRPRRLGVGEGVLVVSDAPRARSAPTPRIPVSPAAAPPPGPLQSTPLTVRGVLGWVSFDGQWVVIGKDGVGHIYKGERRYHVSHLSGVAVKAATRLHHGYFQVLVAGLAPAPVVRFGANAGRPPMTDDNSISFAKAANDDIGRLRDAVQRAIDTAHGRTPTAAPSVPTSPAGKPAAPSIPASRTRADRDTATSTGPVAGRGEGRPSPQRQEHRDPTPDPAADHGRGEHDGAQAARRLPLASLDTLVAHQFDVVRWLAPWREHWQRTLNQPPAAARPPAWLPDLAQYLGSHAAPPGSTNSAITPSPAYLAGFCVGLRTTWTAAVTSRLLPGDRLALAHWLTQLPDQLKLSMPLAEATLDDLQTARQRVHRSAVLRGALRSLLWITIGLLLLLEIAAIAITIQGDWTNPDGTVAANQAPNAILANVSCLIPLIALAVLAAVDLRRMRRTTSTKPAAPAAPPTSGTPLGAQHPKTEAPRSNGSAGHGAPT